MKPRIVYLHGNQAMHWSLAWAPWLKQELEKRGFKTFFETFPDSIIAREEYWLAFLKEYIKAGENDVLVGWSSGGVAAMRYAEKNVIRGSVLVAPSYTDLNDPLEKESGYFDTDWNWEMITKNPEHTALFYSKNDPYIPQEQFTFIAKKLNPEVFLIPHAGHFIEKQRFLELLNYLLKTYK